MYPSIPSAPPEEGPPSYDSAVNRDALPPSYEELFGDLRNADSPSAFARVVDRLWDSISRTVAATVVFALLNIVPIGMILLGSINKDHCPIQPLIPTWLIVTGVSYLIRSLIGLYTKYYESKNPGHKVHLCIRLIACLLNVFLAIWFILGSIWIFVAYSSHTVVPGTSTYCDQFMYTFAFVFIILSYVLLFISCLFCCCCCCFICCRKSPHERVPIA